MPNGEIKKPTHTALLDQPDLPLQELQAQHAHTFPGPKKALLSIGKIYEHGCELTFNDKSVHINNKQIGKTIMRGKQDARAKLYMLSLIQKNNLMTESTTPDKYFVGSAYGVRLKKTLVDYHQASCWSHTH